MNIFNSIDSYIKENEVKIIILEKKINIVNYIDIGHFDSNKIVVKVKDKDIIIKGNDLVVSKLMNNEILITGSYNNIEFR